MRVTVNDEAVEVENDTTVSALLATLGIPEKGIAVAVDWDGAAPLGVGAPRCPTGPRWKW